ncbi:MAG: hypothetical protein LRY71_04320 [Bacillaceae bacterium]|nr:hypothetical protein [Bacillaceae bacterium]
MFEFISDLPLFWLSFIISIILIALYMNQSKPYSSSHKLEWVRPEKTVNLFVNVRLITFLRVLLFKRKIPTKEKGTRSADEEAPISPFKFITKFKGGKFIVNSTFVHHITK